MDEELLANKSANIDGQSANTDGQSAKIDVPSAKIDGQSAKIDGQITKIDTKSLNEWHQAAEEILKKSSLRNFGRSISEGIRNSWMGHYYTLIHNCIVILGALVILFSNNLMHLAIIVFILLMDGGAIIAMHNCPLTWLEKQYLNVDYILETKKILHGSDVLYNCPHTYESQLEYVINVWCFVVLKILALMLMRTFSITVKA